MRRRRGGPADPGGRAPGVVGDRGARRQSGRRGLGRARRPAPFGEHLGHVAHLRARGGRPARCRGGHRSAARWPRNDRLDRCPGSDRDLERQFFGFVAQRQPDAVRACTSATTRPLICSPCATRRDLPPAVSRRKAVALPSTISVPVQRELAALHRRLRGLGDGGRRRPAGRVEERALDDVPAARRAPRRAGIPAASRPSRRLRDDRRFGRRHRDERAAPVRLPQDEQQQHGLSAPASRASCASSPGVLHRILPSLRRRGRRGRGAGRGGAARGTSGYANADTSSCTLISGSCPGRRLEAAERVERPDRQVVDDQVGHLRLERAAGSSQRRRRREELDVHRSCLNRPSSRGPGFWLVVIRPPLFSIAARTRSASSARGEVGRGVLEVEPASVLFLHRVRARAAARAPARRRAGTARAGR